MIWLFACTGPADEGLTDASLGETGADEPAGYACGWEAGDPGDLSSTGAQIGDTIANVSLHDQCGEEVPLWDFAGEWHIAFMTTAWCSACFGEASGLDESGVDFEAETGIDFSYLVVIFESATGDPARPEDAAPYAEVIGDPEIPVLSDPGVAMVAATPFDGKELPGKCLLSPEMEILSCWTGHDNDDDALDIIRGSN